MTVTEVPPAKAERWTAQWKELYEEVITTGLCTGCAGCVVTCPHDVIGYEHEEGKYKPFHLEEELGPDNCIHGEKGCTTCTRACPRFRTWEPEIDEHLFGRPRDADEVYGVFKDIILARATDKATQKAGQDGGLVSAILNWCLEHGYIDAALVSYLEGDGTSAVGGVAPVAGHRSQHEVSAVGLNSARDRLVIEVWTPEHGVRTIERA